MSSTDDNITETELCDYIEDINKKYNDLYDQITDLHKRLLNVETVVSDGITHRVRLLKSNEFIELRHKIDTIERLILEKSESSEDLLFKLSSDDDENKHDIFNKTMYPPLDKIH